MLSIETISETVVWASITSAGALFCLLKTRSNFKKMRLIQDMPTSLIRSASQGFIELVGVGKLLNEPLLSPLTSLPCLWWRYHIERYQKGGGHDMGKWVSVERNASEAPFNFDDGTGICQIFPDGAELSTRHRHRWYGHSRKANPSLLAKALGPGKHAGGLSLGGFGRRYRFTEDLIIEGDPLYVLGHFETDATGQRTLSADRLTGNILRHWKQDFNALLEQYDTNNDGELCFKEWRQVRAEASKLALKQQLASSQKAVEHSVRKPEKNGLPFIIGSGDQIKLTRSLRVRSTFFALGFLGLGSAATWLWNAQAVI